MNMKKLITILILLFAVGFVQAKDVSLQWDHDCDATGFHVYRSQGSKHWPELVGTVSCPDRTFTDTDIPNGSLSWIVTAYNEENESTASNEIELAYYYARTLFDYDANGMILYRGENDDISALTSDDDWVVSKYYYTNGSLTEIRVRTMSWDSRTTGW